MSGLLLAVDTPVVIGFGIGWVFGLVIGLLIGIHKGRPVLGAVLGAILSFIGWIIMAVIPSKEVTSGTSL